jgi:hypothetical protein
MQMGLVYGLTANVIQVLLQGGKKAGKPGSKKNESDGLNCLPHQKQ